MKIIYKQNIATKYEILNHLLEVDNLFTPHLSSKVNLKSFSLQIYDCAITIEAWNENKLVGLLSAYFNDFKNKSGFINHIAVSSKFQNLGISIKLLKKSFAYAKKNEFKSINLEVAKKNTIAMDIYIKLGFKSIDENTNNIIMGKKLKDKVIMKRDFNKEIIDNDREYAYSFDFNVMHPFMIKSFEPFFKKDESFLELGCFKGDFTKRFCEYFTDVTCVEASSDAIKEAKKKVPNNVKFFNELFENVTLPKKYDNIVLTHVLEHLDDPVKVLKRINDEWLSDEGRLFLVTPNAMAPSRQIAVKMGLISHNSAVTPAESEHGHKITYTLDTLERDAKSADLRVIYRSGIFFKALANFQWDKILQTDIISPEYLQGCYEIGQQYPELCSSIFLLCEKSK